MGKKSKVYERYEQYKNIINRNLDEDFLKTVPIDAFNFTPYNNKFLHDNNIDTLFDLLSLDIGRYFEVFKDHPKNAKRINNGLLRVCKKYSIAEDGSVVGPSYYLFDAFEILNKAPDEFLDRQIDYSSTTSNRLYNALKVRNELNTYRDLRDFGMNRLCEVPYLGKKCYKELSALIREGYALVEKKPEVFIVKKEDPDKNQSQSAIRILIDLFKECSKDFNYESENGYNGKDYSFFQAKLRTLFFDYAIEHTSSAEKRQIFALRNEQGKKRTLEEVGKQFNLTRERIRQIDKKIKERTVAHFISEIKSKTEDKIIEFYKTLIFLGKNDLLYYCSYSQLMKDLDYLVISEVLNSGMVGEKTIPEYIKTDARREEREMLKAQEEMKKEKDLIRKIQGSLYSKKEKLILICLLECLKNSHRITQSILCDYMNGKGFEGVDPRHFGCDKTIDIYEVRKAISKYANLKLVRRHRIKRGHYYLSINLDLLNESKLLERFENSKSVDLSAKTLEFDPINIIILKCIKSLDFRFGASLIRDVLIGSKNERILSKNLDKNEYYCALRATSSRNDIINRIYRLIEKGYVVKQDMFYSCIGLSALGLEAIE